MHGTITYQLEVLSGTLVSVKPLRYNLSFSLDMYFLVSISLLLFFNDVVVASHGCNLTIPTKLIERAHHQVLCLLQQWLRSSIAIA